MFTPSLSTLPRWLPALAAALLMTVSVDAMAVASAGPTAEDDRVLELEARVAELEALVHQLMHEHRPPVTDPAAVEDMAEKAAEAKTTALLEEHHDEEAELARRHSYKFGGFVKLDALYSDFGGGPVPSSSVGRDYYLPATLPIGGAAESYLDFHAKSSRVNFASSHELDDGAHVSTFVEIDFMMSDTGDERISNSYQPRLRHAFLTYQDWLFGQTWTTFFNVAALPENLDFIGPAESTVFVRQAQVRYSHGPWSISLENPETTVTPYGGGTRIDADDSRLPDAVLRYDLDAGGSSFALAGILRQLRYEDGAIPSEDTATGYGISVSGVTRFGERDDFRWMATTGKGLGRYVGLNTANGAMLDADGNLEALGLFSLFGSYRHFWSDRWRSNLTLGYLSVDNDVGLTGPDVTQAAWSAHLNLIYSPRPNLDVGVEFLYADRELENGDNGDLERLQFSARYAY